VIFVDVISLLGGITLRTLSPLKSSLVLYDVLSSLVSAGASVVKWVVVIVLKLLSCRECVHFLFDLFCCTLLFLY